MTLLEALLLLVIAGVCGSIAQALAGASRGGCLVAVALGFIGAMIGTWIAKSLGLPQVLAVRVGDQPFPILWSIIGAALFVALLSALTGRRRQS